MGTCGHCGYESAGSSTCPLCGGVIRADAAPAGADPAPVAGPAWEDDRTPFPRNLVGTWTESVLDPGRFFRNVPWEAPAGRPILYYLLMSVVAALFSLFWTGVARSSDIALFRSAYIPFETEFDAGFTLIGFFLTPFLAIVGLFIGAAIFHLFVLIVARERRAFVTTVRALSYASGPLLFQIVPVVGGLIAMIWSLVLVGVGIREGHRTTTGGAVTIVLMAVLVPLFALFALAVCAAFVLAPGLS